MPISAIVYARLFPQVGLGQSAELAIQSFCRQVAFAEEGLQPPRILVGNLSTQRDYSDVEETAIALAHLGFRGAAGEAYNMASGRAHRMASILQMIIDQAKTRIAVEVDPKRIRPADESLLLGDTRKIREALGWHPIMDLRRAIRRILEYWRKHASRAAAARSIMIEPLRRNKAAGEMNGGSIPRMSRQLVDNGAINDTRAGARLCKTAQIVPALDSGDARRDCCVGTRKGGERPSLPSKHYQTATWFDDAISCSGETQASAAVLDGQRKGHHLERRVVPCGRSVPMSNPPGPLAKHTMEGD